MWVGNSNTDQTHLICEPAVVSNRSPAVLFSTLPCVDWQLGVNGCFSGKPSKLHVQWGGDLRVLIVCRRAAQRLITWWNQRKLVMIALPGVAWPSNSTDRILTPIFTSLFYLPCLLSKDGYGPPPSSLTTNQPWHLGVTKYSWRVTFKPLKSESNLRLGTLFASWIFMSALLFYDSISELIQGLDFTIWSSCCYHWELATHSRSMLFSTMLFSVTFLCLVTVSSHDVDFIKQIKVRNMSERNIKTRLSSAFLVAQRNHLHLLTASQRESEEITKTGFYFTPGSSLRFPFQCGHDSCSVTDVICLFHLAP